MADTGGPKLRVMTYLAPALPLDLFQMCQHYLEELLGQESYLMVESRWTGPPKDRIDPFTTDDVDIAFMSSTAFLRQTREKNQFMELLPVAPVHKHPISDLRPVYYTDIIVHADRSKIFKELHDLKGHKWAYSDDDSLSGCTTMLKELKRLGTNANFFGHIIKSGCHLRAIEAVLANRADTASVDSTILHHFLKRNAHIKDKIHILCSLGPLPIYPIVLNSRLPAEIKKKIEDGLLNMNTLATWKTELEKYDMWGFKPIDESFYTQETELRNSIQDHNVQAVYY